jgi:hypothetical protein
VSGVDLRCMYCVEGVVVARTLVASMSADEIKTPRSDVVRGRRLLVLANRVMRCVKCCNGTEMDRHS